MVDGYGWDDADLPGLAGALMAIPGVVGHGLFLTEIDAAYIAGEGSLPGWNGASGALRPPTHGNQSERGCVRSHIQRMRPVS